MSSPISTLSGWLGQSVPGQPGVGSTNQNNGEVQLNDIPIPGQPGAYYNPATGQIIRTSQGGNPVVAGAPNLAQLTAIGANNQLLEQQQQQKLQQQQQQTFQAQGDLASDLRDTIAGHGPSVAQLGQGLAQINGTQLGNAAGATGENAAAARRTAAQTIAGAGVGLNAQEVAIRAQQIAAAQSGLSGLLNSQLGAEGQGISTATGAATTYGGQDITAQGTSAGIAEKGNEANAKANSNLLGTIGNGIAAIGGLA